VQAPLFYRSFYTINIRVGGYAGGVDGGGGGGGYYINIYKGSKRPFN
jgi:hypothetical protein